MVSVPTLLKNTVQNSAVINFTGRKKKKDFLTGCLRTTQLKVTGFHKYCFHKSAWCREITLFNNDRSFVNEVCASFLMSSVEKQGYDVNEMSVT